MKTRRGFEDGKDVEGGSFVGDAASVGIRTLAASATDDGLLNISLKMSKMLKVLKEDRIAHRGCCS